MQEERNCLGKYISEERRKSEFPPHKLGNDENGLPMYAWECLTLSVSEKIWSVIDLFWLCHIAVSGMSTADIRRVGLPEEGAVVDQQNWIMEAFKIIHNEFHIMNKGLEEERQREQESNRQREEMKKKYSK